MKGKTIAQKASPATPSIAAKGRKKPNEKSSEVDSSNSSMNSNNKESISVKPLEEVKTFEPIDFELDQVKKPPVTTKLDHSPLKIVKNDSTSLSQFFKNQKSKFNVWTYLFYNLNTAISEILTMCELEGQREFCEGILTTLSSAQEDAKKIVKKIELETAANPKQEDLVWEILPLKTSMQNLTDIDLQTEETLNELDSIDLSLLNDVINEGKLSRMEAMVLLARERALAMQNEYSNFQSLNGSFLSGDVLKDGDSHFRSRSFTPNKVSMLKVVNRLNMKLNIDREKENETTNKLSNLQEKFNRADFIKKQIEAVRAEFVLKEKAKFEKMKTKLLEEKAAKENKIKEKHVLAEKRYELFINKIKQKASDEVVKSNEINFIVMLQNQAKKLSIDQKLEETHKRRIKYLESIKSKGKEEAEKRKNVLKEKAEKNNKTLQEKSNLIKKKLDEAEQRKNQALVEKKKSAEKWDQEINLRRKKIDVDLVDGINTPREHLKIQFIKDKEALDLKFKLLQNRRRRKESIGTEKDLSDYETMSEDSMDSELNTRSLETSFIGESYYFEDNYIVLGSKKNNNKNEKKFSKKGGVSNKKKKINKSQKKSLASIEKVKKINMSHSLSLPLIITRKTAKRRLLKRVLQKETRNLRIQSNQSDLKNNKTEKPKVHKAIPTPKPCKSKIVEKKLSNSQVLSKKIDNSSKLSSASPEKSDINTSKCETNQFSTSFEEKKANTLTDLTVYLQNEDDAIVDVISVRWCSICDYLLKNIENNDDHLQSKEHKKIKGSYSISNTDDQTSIITFKQKKGSLDEALKSERMNALKKKSKKIRMKLINKAMKHETAAAKEPMSTISSSNKPRLSKLNVELEKMTSSQIKDYDGIQEILKELIKILEKNLEGDIQLIRQLKIIPSILPEITKMGVVQKNSMEQCFKIVELGIKFLYLFCNNRENRNYMIYTNRILPLIDLLNWCLNKPTKFIYSLSFIPDLFQIITLHLKHRVSSEHQGLKDELIYYIFCSGLLFKLKDKFITFHDGLDLTSANGKVPLAIIKSLNFLEALTFYLISNYRDKPIFVPCISHDSINFVLKESELIGCLGLLASILLAEGSYTKQVKKILPQTILYMLLSCLKIINNICYYDIKIVTSILVASYNKEQTYHVLLYLFSYGTENYCNSEDVKDVLNEAILFAGYITLLNEKNQEMLAIGDQTVLSKILNLPINYFMPDTKEYETLFPTLVCSCFKNQRNKEIISKEVSMELLENFIAQHIKLFAKEEKEINYKNDIENLYLPNHVSRLSEKQVMPTGKLERKNSIGSNASSTNSSAPSSSFFMNRHLLGLRFPREFWEEFLLFTQTK